MSADSFAPFIPPALGLLGIVGIVFVTLFFVGLARRGRLKTLRNRFPDAVVFEGFQTFDFARTMQTLGERDAKADRAYVAVVDKSGITFFQGFGDVRPFKEFAWADNTTITESSVSSSNRGSLNGLLLRTVIDGQALSLPIGVYAGRFGGFSYPKPEEIADLLNSISNVNGRAITKPTPRTSATSTLQTRRVDLVPGVSAGRWAQTVTPLTSLIAIPFALMVLGLFWVSAGDMLRLVSVILAAGLSTVVFIVYVLFHRANKREKQAGYTTLPAGDINLPHVDPVTGVVLREAGEPQLSKAELKAAAEERKRLAR